MLPAACSPEWARVRARGRHRRGGAANEHCIRPPALSNEPSRWWTSGDSASGLVRPSSSEGVQELHPAGVLPRDPYGSKSRAIPASRTCNCRVADVESHNMLGQMMQFPLTLPSLLERSGRLFGGVEIVSRLPDKSIHRSNYASTHWRARALASALARAGLGRGERVGTLMWNHAWHLEAYFGVPLSGGVLHVLNLRLHPDELSYIINHAGDRMLLIDDVLRSEERRVGKECRSRWSPY